MAENGGAEVKTEPTENGERTEDHQKLLDHGIDIKVADELDNIYKSGILSHSDLDSRALDALKEFHADGGIAILKEFKDSNLEHVSNKSAYLCGVMKTYRQKNKMGADATVGGAKKPGPDETKLKEILERTGYSLDVTTGQRKYGGPPPDSDAQNQPGAGHEVFCGKIPKEIFEDELVPLFEKCGRIWDLRLMMDPLTGLNRGYCFVTFCNKDGAQEAVKQVDNFELKPGKRLKINVSVANLRLFVGNIPKSKSRDEIREEFSKHCEGLQEVIIYSSPDDNKKRNRGFAFLEFDSHKMASVAKRRIGNGRTRVWGCDIIVDWADPQEEPDNDTMEKVKVLYVRNLKADTTEEQIKEKFEKFGKVERVKKIKDYGFVHFEERDHAVQAMDELNGVKLGESELQISLAKPPVENKKKEQRRRDQQGRMIGGRGFDDFWMPMGPSRGGMGGGNRRPMRGGQGGRGGFRGGEAKEFYGDSYGYGDYGYDDYGYDDYGYDSYDNYGSSSSSNYGGGYGSGPRGRGRGGPPPPPPGRGRGGIPPRGARVAVGQGARGAARGARGAMTRGAGRGGRGGAGGRGGPLRGGAAGKRKAGGDHNQGLPKKRNTQDSWGAQPIAQQPLGQAGGYEDQWYQDSYGAQQWG